MERGGWLKTAAQRAWRSWVARSVSVSTAAFLVDVAIRWALYSGFGCSVRVSASVGVCFGTSLNFLGNRWVAFRAHHEPFLRPFVRWLVTTALQVAIHGQLSVMLVDWFHVPFLLATMVADFLVFTLGQLLLFRFVIFRKNPDAAKSPPSAPTGAAPIDALK